MFFWINFLLLIFLGFSLGFFGSMLLFPIMGAWSILVIIVFALALGSLVGWFFPIS